MYPGRLSYSCMALTEPELSLVNFQKEYEYISYALVSLSTFFFSIFPHSHLPSLPRVLISALPRTPSPTSAGSPIKSYALTTFALLSSRGLGTEKWVSLGFFMVMG